MSLTDAYLWLKALHVAAAMMFVGGLLAISIVLLHVAAPGAPQRSLAISVHRWDRRVTVPALLLVWALGLTLAVEGRHLGEGWLQLKLILVAALSGLHGIQSGKLRRLAGGAEVRARHLTLIISALAFGVAILAVAKPL